MHKKWIAPCWLAALIALALNLPWFAYVYVSHWSQTGYLICLCAFVAGMAAFTLFTLLLKGGMKRGRLALLTAASAVAFLGLHAGSGGIFNIALYHGSGKGPVLAASAAILLAAAQIGLLAVIGKRALRDRAERAAAAPVILALGVITAALLVLGAHTKLFYVDEPVMKKPAPPQGETALTPYVPAAPALAPRLIETLYPTEDAVVAEIVATEAPYAADPTGRTDSTAAIQQVIDDCALAGGGTVWLPAGRYLVTGSVAVRTYVTLRGDWQDPDEGTAYGTIILAKPPSSDALLPGLFAVDTSAGVLGLTVYYPDQRIDDVKPYPYTFSAAAGMLQSVVNCTVLNGYRGLGAVDDIFHEQLTVENFKGTFLSVGIASYRGSDTGTTKNVSIDPKYWTEAAQEFACADPAALRAYTRVHTTGIELGDMDWEQFSNVRIRGCETGVRTVRGYRESGFIGSFYDLDVRDCGVGVSVEYPDPHGFNIANSHVEGDEAAIKNIAGNKLRTCGVEIVGPVEGKLLQTEFEALPRAVDYNRKPPRPPARLFAVEADASGMTDCAAAIQQAIDECAAAGGGVVYLPAGRYRLSSPVTVPAHVELRGTAATAQREWYASFEGRDCPAGGAVIYAYQAFCETEAQADRAEALITLAGEGAGIRGLRFVCPENKLQYDMPPSAYLIRGRAQGVYAVNLSLLAPWNGIDFRGCDGHLIKKITCFAFHNMAAAGGENGMVEGCLHNGNLYRHRYDFPDWPFQDCGGVFELRGYDRPMDVFPLIFDSTSRVQTDVLRIADAKGQTVLNTISFGTRTLIDAENSENTLVVNYNADAVGHTPLFWRFSAGVPALRVSGGGMVAINELRSRGRLFEASGGARVSVYNRDETA